jgi:hypothetical protein
MRIITLAIPTADTEPPERIGLAGICRLLTELGRLRNKGGSDPALIHGPVVKRTAVRLMSGRYALTWQSEPG